jgi:hypothetical protein
VKIYVPIGKIPHQKERGVEAISRIIVHRIDFSDDDGGGGYWKNVQPLLTDRLDGDKVIARFKDDRRVKPEDRIGDGEWRDRPGAYTGGLQPYTFLICAGGRVDQMLELSDYGPHARRWSWSGVSIAVAGDFRDPDVHPAPSQQEALVELVAVLSSLIERNPFDCVMGHSDLPDASSDPAKICPGPGLDMDKLRWAAEAHDAAQATKEETRARLVSMGVLF